MKQAIGIVFSAALVTSPLASWSDEPLPFPEFTFKRVKIPAPGSNNLIDIQIDPAARVARITAPTILPETPTPKSEAYAWFWDQVSPELANSDTGRFELAVDVLRKSASNNGLAAPRLQDMQALVDKFGTDILIASVGTRVSPALVLAVMGVESGGRANVVSSAGAVGLMQLIPATAERFGVKDPTIAAENIRGGIAYLDWLMGEFNNDPIFALAAYNAGENAVKRNGGVPDYAETRAYVPKVLAAWGVARALCLTPPELVSDGCVFAQQKAQN